ncbi:type VI secretion system tube protein Hcp [Marivibrio halodurans]|uniref:Type VI secretion system tube protein Hcp n=1 Tax=Marivibrio halodurans TaxID=2039722 RepID=A0A8J7RZ67_9PROT|nr:type VI secretion system tube protein Hcp [Marivibrio halodurans]MBP5857372.1 type VI secretion system tube protein Hcp [Marivibrio halodurans]
MDVLVMKIDGVEGEATIEGYEKQILCQSFNHSVHNHLHTDVSNVGRSRGRVEHSDFVISKYADKSSPLLNFKCCMGANLGTVIFTVLRTAGEKAHTPQLIYTFENAMVSSVSISGGGGDTPIEMVSLNYTKIKWEVKVQSQDVKEPGSIASEWDVTVNKGA